MVSWLGKYKTKVKEGIKKECSGETKEQLCERAIDNILRGAIRGLILRGSVKGLPGLNNLNI